jgi:ferritin-like metal-binding protein YciE
MEVNVARDKDEAINSYITDMLSLEEHIEKALRGQLEDLKDYPDVIGDLKQIHRKVEHHISDLSELSQRRNARTPADALKRVGSSLLGFGAAAVDWSSTRGCPRTCGTTTPHLVWPPSVTSC